MTSRFGEMEIAERLKVIRTKLKLSQKEMGALMGVSQRAYSSYEAGKTTPSVVAVRPLVEFGWTSDWIVTGREGDQLPLRMPTTVGTSVSADTVAIPHYAVELSAGNGRQAADFEEFEPLVVPKSWVHRVFGRPAAHLVLAGAAGTSMEPTIRDRDLLVVDRSDRRLTSGRIYALAVGDTLVVKRIERTLRGQIFLRPDNPAYQSEELTPDLADTVRIIGQVIWHGGTVE